MYNCIISPNDCEAKWLSECAISECLSVLALRKLNEFSLNECSPFDCASYLQGILDAFSIFELIEDEMYESTYLWIGTLFKESYRESSIEKLKLGFELLSK